MHQQGNSLTRWIHRHRRELATAAGLALVVMLLFAALPLLVALSVVERRTTNRRKNLAGVALARLLAQAAVWLWRDLRGVPHGRWHPCAQCGIPIEEPSRARYCSSACRRYARLERDARAFDPVIAERAGRRLRVLRDDAWSDPALSEIPF